MPECTSKTPQDDSGKYLGPCSIEAYSGQVLTCSIEFLFSLLLKIYPEGLHFRMMTCSKFARLLASGSLFGFCAV